MDKGVYFLIREAILKKDQIVAKYDGHLRELCPHIIGEKNGKPRVLCYQFGGSSSSGLSPIGSPDNWRCILIEKLTEVYARPGPWYSAIEPLRDQTCIDRIDVRVGVGQ